MAPSPPKEVVVHPLVLLSVVDHYNRVARDTKKRVVGIILGETYKGRVDATNSFAGRCRECLLLCSIGSVNPLIMTKPCDGGWNSAVPFEEDERDPSIWFMDHSYLENMFRMFKKVNGK